MMKNQQILKIFLVIFILMAGANISQSKIIGVYTLEELPQINPPKLIGITTVKEYKRSSASFYLNIYHNKIYRIVMNESLSEDREAEYDISFGNYKVINNILYLYDTYNKYEMQYLIKNNKLIPNKAFRFLMNKAFIKSSDLSYESDANDKTTKISLNKSRADYASSHKTKILLYYGTYGPVDDFNFVIQSNHNYTIKHDKLVISDGSWKRKENELICYDSNLKHNFYLSIGEKSIINRFFPCLYDNCDLYDTFLLQEIMIKAD